MFYCFSGRWGGGRRKNNWKEGLPGPWERNTCDQVWGHIGRSLSGARKQQEEETEAAVNLARCPVLGLQNLSEWVWCLAPPSLPSGALGASTPGPGSPVGLGLLAFFHPSFSFPSWVGSLGLAEAPVATV